MFDRNAGRGEKEAVITQRGLSHAKKPPLVRVSDGGIGDVEANQVGNLGNVQALKIPVAVTPLVANSSLWPAPVTFPVTAAGVTNATETVILQAASQSPKNPKNLLISIDPPSFINNVADADIDIKAKIDFGIGGDRNIILVDAMNGAQLTLAASDIIISGVYTTINVGTAPAPRLGASIGYGERGSSNFGPSFTNRGLIAPAGSFGCMIPPYARALTALAINQTTGLSVPLRFTLQSLTGSVTLATFLQAVDTQTVIALPNGASRILVLAPGAANNVDVSLRFDLAL